MNVHLLVMVWGYLQLCKIVRAFPGRVETRKQQTLQQSNIGVATSGHFLLCVARGTLDTGKGLRRCELESEWCEGQWLPTWPFLVACVYLKKPRTKKRHCALGLWAQFY